MRESYDKVLHQMRQLVHKIWIMRLDQSVVMLCSQHSQGYMLAPSLRTPAIS